MRNQSFLDQVNETPTTYAILLIYVTMAMLTRMTPSSEQMVQYGASAGLLIQDGQVWRLLTCAFLHGNLLHLLLNSYALLLFGPTLERHMGVGRFILLYAVTASCGSLHALLYNEEFRFLVGGSGALFGMLGAMLAYSIRGGRSMLDFLDHHGSRQLIAMVVLNLLFGFLVPVISNSAHIGGLVSGFALVFCYLNTGRQPVDSTGRAIQLGWIAVVCGLLLYGVNPVLRYGHAVQSLLQASDPQTRERYGQLLQRLERRGLANIETRGSYQPFRKLIRRWERGH